MPDTPAYDVFVAYSPAEEDWVHAHLQPDLQAAGLTVATQEDFTPGRPKVDNWERTLTASRLLLLVITPAWLEDNWQGFARQLAHQLDVDGREGRVIPLLLQPTPEMPGQLDRLTLVDFTDPARLERQWSRLLKALGIENGVVLDDLPIGSLAPYAPLPTGRRIPYSHNNLFTGRESELLALATALQIQNSGVLIRTVVLIGLGGIGKTQLATEFVYRYRNFFRGGVYWLNFADPKAIPNEVAQYSDFEEGLLPNVIPHGSVKKG